MAEGRFIANQDVATHAAVVVLAPSDIIALYREDGFLVYEDPAQAVEVLAAMGRLGDGFAQGGAGGGHHLPAPDIPGRHEILRQPRPHKIPPRWQLAKIPKG